MKLPSLCYAYQDRTGQYVCNRCGYQWDADDNDDRPKCKTTSGLVKEKQLKKDLAK